VHGKGIDQWKMPNEGYNVNMHIIFHGMMLLGIATSKLTKMHIVKEGS